MSKTHLFGWEYDPRVVDETLGMLRRPAFTASAAASGIRGSGAGEISLLHKAVEQVLGQPMVPTTQTIGDCVSHGWAQGIEVLACIQILRGALQQWKARIATEILYAYSRVEIGGGRLSGDGSYGGWAARAASEGGVLARGQYGSIDLRRYSGSRARDWGRRGRGVPDSLEPTMREHLVRSVSLVTSYEDARDALYQGYPIPVCSMQGFASRRDSEGFAKPSGSWAHCMLFLAVDDQHRRPGCLCLNSWGPNWISGPKRHDQPDGSFWVDADVVDSMLRRNPDSYVISQYDGYPAQRDYLLF